MQIRSLDGFSAFWLGANVARKAQGLPELLYGEARDLREETERSFRCTPASIATEHEAEMFSIMAGVM